MLKPLHIICLFTLLGVGLVGCEKKEQQINTLPDSEVLQEVFTIKDISEYDTADYYVNPSILQLTTSGGGGGINYDINGDEISDIYHFFNYQYNPQTQIGTTNNNLTILLPDSILRLYATGSNSSSLLALQLGDTIPTSLFWSEARHMHFDIIDVSYNTPQYIIFRKKDGIEYKYGWIYYKRQTSFSQIFGPSVMQR